MSKIEQLFKALDNLFTCADFDYEQDLMYLQEMAMDEMCKTDFDEWVKSNPQPDDTEKDA